MTNFKTPPVRDKAYLRSFKGGMCWSCGTSDETVVGAHIRWGHEGGTGLKPSDDLVIPLCWICHKDFDEFHNAEWLANMVKRMARRQYEAWKAGYR